MHHIDATHITTILIGNNYLLGIVLDGLLILTSNTNIINFLFMEFNMHNINQSKTIVNIDGYGHINFTRIKLMFETFTGQEFWIQCRVAQG